jgi:hypothetical protein
MLINTWFMVPRKSANALTRLGLPRTVTDWFELVEGNELGILYL